MALDTLFSLVLVAGLATLIVLICYWLKQPSIIGFLLTGVLLGPSCFNFFADAASIKELADVGVILLLFVIGLDFSFKDLLRSRTYALLGGTVQIGGTILIVAGMAMLGGVNFHAAIVMGFLGSLSSTAIVLKLFESKFSLEGPAGRCTTLILIFQDMAAIPMMLIIPFLAVGAGHFHFDMPAWAEIIKVLIILGALLVAAPWGIPRVLRLVAETRNQELFILAVVFSCLAVAGFTAWSGMSMALGAFIAGMIIADSPYNQQAVNYIIPFRDLFIGVFFLSIGMLLDVNFVWDHLWMVLMATLVVIAAKTLGAGLAGVAVGLPLRAALLVGLSLAQVGEFSFVLAQLADSLGIIQHTAYQLFLAVSIVTMALTPLAMSLGGYLYNRRLEWSLPMAAHEKITEPPNRDELSDHIIIIGFGPAGQAISQAAKNVGIPYVVVELNAFTVRQQKRKGQSIVYGDAGNPAVLEHVGLSQARLLVATIGGLNVIKRVVSTAHTLKPDLYIIARAHFASEAPELLRLGASEVVSEEYEVEVELFARVLRWHLLPKDEIDRQVDSLRASGYTMQRRLDVDDPNYIMQSLHNYLPKEMTIISQIIETGAPLDGSDLGILKVRNNYGIIVLTVHRPGQEIKTPTADMPLKAGDMLLIMGKSDLLEAARKNLFKTPVPDNP